MPLEPLQNTGFIPQDPRDSDWKAGETGIADEILVADGDWTPYLPEGEWQKLMGVPYNGGNGFDTDACVTFSYTNAIETLLNFLISVGRIPAGHVQWLQDNGYIVNGKVNFSDRALAKLSGTTYAGNTLGKVADTARNLGLIPEADWPFPIDEIKADVQNAWQIYYKEIPSEVLLKGLEFKKRFLLNYDWKVYPGSGATPSSIQQMLKMTPLQLATAVCPPWNTDQIIQACGAGVGHATTMYGEESSDYKIFDHYVPFGKRFAIDYTISYAMRHMVTPIVEQVPVPPVAFTHHFTKQMDLGQTNDEIVALQNALKSIGLFPKSVTSTGYFGTITQTAVKAYQTREGIVNAGDPASTGYGRVGPTTLKHLNEDFDK